MCLCSCVCVCVGVKLRLALSELHVDSVVEPKMYTTKSQRDRLTLEEEAILQDSCMHVGVSHSQC